MSEFSHVLRADEVPSEGQQVAIEAEEGQRRAIAQRLGLARLEALSATLDITPLPGGGLEIAGQLNAVVEQLCVVSLEPLVSEIVRPLRLRFLPLEDFRAHEASLEAEGGAAAAGPDEFDVEPLNEGSLDLAELVLQELSLALDPYPRKAGAIFETIGQAEESGGQPTRRPFAALGEMMNKGG